MRLLSAVSRTLGALAALDGFDILRPHAHLDDELVLHRHDLHDVLAGFDDAARGVIAQLDDDALDRRGDPDAVQHALALLDPLAHVVQFGPRLVQLLHGRFDGGVADAGDLLAARAIRSRASPISPGEPADLALEIGARALQRQDFRLADQAALAEARSCPRVPRR